jgi:hypothetical protein
MAERFLSAVKGVQPQWPRETLLAIEGYTQQPRGFLLAIKRNHPGRWFFFITDPTKPLDFGALTPNPSGVFVFLYSNFLLGANSQTR